MVSYLQVPDCSVCNHISPSFSFNDMLRDWAQKDQIKNFQWFCSSSPVLRSNFPRITYREIMEATEDFRQDRLVGSGIYCRVYRGVLRDGSIVLSKSYNCK